MLCGKTNFLSHGQKWARLWFGSYEKITIKQNTKKTKLLNMMVPNFYFFITYGVCKKRKYCLYSDSYHSSILLLHHYYYRHSFFLSYYYHTYFLTAQGKATDPQLFFNISKENLMNILFHKGDCVKYRIWWENDMQGPTLYTSYVISSEMGQRKILCKK